MENKKIKCGQEIELKISDLAFGGQGVSKVYKLIFFVKDGIPNQKIIAKISKVKKKYVEAYNIKTLLKSENEIEPKCEHFKYCGGCTTQQLDYNNQLFYKQKQIKEIFTKIGKLINPKINPIISSKKIFYYRNKMQYTFSGNPWFIKDESYDDIIIGLHVSKRFDKILSIKKCHINNKIFNDIINIAKKVSIKENLIPYDVIKHTGYLRFLVLRIGVHTQEIMVNIVTSKNKPFLIKPMMDEIIANIPNIKSVVNTININKNNTDDGDIKLLYGRDFINEKIGNYTFKISANSFFQTNSFQVKTLYDCIIKTAKFKKTDTVYDLYCGTGTIGIYLSKLVKNVYAFDCVENAIKDAKYNANINNINNINFYKADIKDAFKDLKFNLEKPDVIIIDPPRPGLHQEVIKDIIHLSPKKIIYVSCNPSTQARDLQIFLKNNYSINCIQPIDMFPHTPHIESIVSLVKDR